MQFNNPDLPELGRLAVTAVQVTQDAAAPSAALPVVAAALQP